MGGVREVTTRFGKRVYYSADEVPEVIDQAAEMIWRPFPFWQGYLWKRAGGPYQLLLWVNGRYVYDGIDCDVTRLLAHFQGFLDETWRCLEDPRFRRVTYRGDAAGAGARP